MKQSFRSQLLFVLIVVTILLTACDTVLEMGVEPTATTTTVPSATPTPTSAATSTPTATPTATATLLPTETVVPTPTGTPLPSPNAGLYAVVGVTMDDVLNVRTGPSVAHAISGAIPPYGTGIQTFGEGEQVGTSTWVVVQYKGNTGWVNSSHLTRQMGQIEDPVSARATEIVHALQKKDWTTLSSFVHPDKGLRFSPYTFVRVEPDANQEQDLVFDAAQVREFPSDRAVYRWGRFDGTGEPIELTVDAYWSRFIYDAGFWRPHVIGYGEFIGKGNTINNIAQVYPQATTVEYHFEGFDAQYDGLDWRSMRLVLEEKAGTWYLVGIVHDEWTI